MFNKGDTVRIKGYKDLWFYGGTGYPGNIQKCYLRNLDKSIEYTVPVSSIELVKSCKPKKKTVYLVIYMSEVFQVSQDIFMSKKDAEKSINNYPNNQCIIKKISLMIYE